MLGSPRYFLQTLSDKLEGAKNLINNVIVTVRQPGYNLQIRYKIRTRSGI